MANNKTYGYMNTGKRWAPNVEVSGPNVGTVLPGEFRVDPYLSVLMEDTEHPARGVVIPSGRFVAVGFSRQVNSSYQQSLISSGATPITLHDGVNTKPAGMAVNMLFKAQNDFMVDGSNIKFRKGFLAQVPHVVSINNAHGELRSGDRVTGFSGKVASSTVVNAAHVGKPVKWVAKQLHTKTSSAGATHELSAATMAGIQPTVIATYAVGALVTGLTAAYTYASGVWSVAFTGSGNTTITTVLYTNGMDEDQIAGEVNSIRNLKEIKNDNQIMAWVEDGPIFDIPKAFQARNTTAVALGTPGDPSTGETPATVIAGSTYRVANVPMSPLHPIKVYVQGTVTVNGSATTYSSSNWYELPTNMLEDGKNYLFGPYHSVNWATGLIEIANNITVTAIRVTYSHVTDEQFGGILWGKGIDGLTDGSYLTPGATVSSTEVVPANPAGIAAELNYSDVYGALRVFVK